MDVGFKQLNGQILWVCLISNNQTVKCRLTAGAYFSALSKLTMNCLIDFYLFFGKYFKVADFIDD